MIPLSIALALVGLAALWTARDVVLRLHRGSEASEALRVAQEAREAIAAEVEARAAWEREMREEWERVRSEHVQVKARVSGIGGRR